MKTTNCAIAVISGDVVNSTKLNSEQFDQLLHQLKTIQKWISQGHAANDHSISRGDEFQTVVHDIEYALKYAMYYRIGIKALGKAFDCRISFAIASNADLRDSVSESMGEAFILSGRGLKDMKSSRLLFSSDQPKLANQFDLLFKYLDRQLSDLTARQCEVILPMLQNAQALSVNELSQQLHIAAPTVSKSLKASGWSLINELNAHFAKQVLEFKHV